MSDAERNFLKRWLLSVSAVLLVQTCAAGWVMVTDHFEQRELKRVVERMLPQHDEMWWAHYYDKRKDQ